MVWKFEHFWIGFVKGRGWFGNIYFLQPDRKCSNGLYLLYKPCGQVFDLYNSLSGGVMIFFNVGFLRFAALFCSVINSVRVDQIWTKHFIKERGGDTSRRKKGACAPQRLVSITKEACVKFSSRHVWYVRFVLTPTNVHFDFHSKRTG